MGEQTGQLYAADGAVLCHYWMANQLVIGWEDRPQHRPIFTRTRRPEVLAKD